MKRFAGIILRFEVSGEVLTTFREALAKLCHDAGGHRTTIRLRSCRRGRFWGTVDEERARYQVELIMCEASAPERPRGFNQTAG
jgi:hypothetical protein